jgi:5,5'-dehydrodivanillate O-demethylase oxygenase subunit
VRLLAEDFILFRQPDGRLGLLERQCAHRRASLEFGRVEADGIRCCYHGWKYDRAGQCIDTPLEPEESTLKQGVKMKAYAVEEAGGLVFGYVGPQPAPVFPRYDLLFREAGLTVVGADEDHCNWLQRAENTVDQHHLSALHAPVYPQTALKRHHVDWDPAWYGLRIAVHHEGRKPKIDHFLFPSSNRFARARVGDTPSHDLRMRVPTDDTTTTTFWVNTYPSITDQGRLRTKGWEQPTERGVYERVADGWWNLPSHEQDRAAQESQGLIADRSLETLGTTDRGIVLFRKMLLEAMAEVEAGRDPVAVLRQDRGIISFDASMHELKTLASA